MKNDEGAAKQLGQSPQDQANSMQEMYAAQKPPPPLQSNNEKLVEIIAQANSQAIYLFTGGKEHKDMPRISDAETVAQIQQLIVEARIDELDLMHDMLSLEAREAGACDYIHKRTNQLRNTNGKGYEDN